MMKLVRAVFSHRIALVVGVYALLARLLMSHDTPEATLAALFLALVSQLGHRALNYYGNLKDSVKNVVGVHADRLAATEKTVADHTASMDNVRKNIEILTKQIERKSVF